MLHLDEGLLSALLDGELAGAEQNEAETHLRSCAECRNRLAELKGFLQKADQLVTALDDLPKEASTQQSPMRRNYRATAWAASIVLAVGLGFAGRSLLLQRSLAQAPSTATAPMEPARARSGDAPARVADSLVSPAPEEVATRAPTAGPGAGSIGQVQSERRAESDAADIDSHPADRLARTLELQPGTPSSNELSLRGGRSDSAVGYVDGVPATPGYRGSGFAHDTTNRVGTNAFESASVTAATADANIRDSSVSRDRESANPEQSGVAATEPSQASKLAQDRPPQSPAPAMLQPRDERLAIPGNRIGTQVIAMEEAIRLLGGSIRLVDSLAPVRVERIGADSAVRVVYLTVGVEIWLDQQRSRDDSGNLLQSAQATLKARQADGNRLSWNDLHGFYLTLTGPLPVAELERLKARIR